MNKENLRYIAKLIRQHEDAFDLNTYFSNDPEDLFPLLDENLESEHFCGSKACICGWANVVRISTLPKDGVKPIRADYSDEDTAAEYLGLPIRFAVELFRPIDHNLESSMKAKDWWPWVQARELDILAIDDSPYDATGLQAAQVLEAIADERITIPSSLQE